ncbi:hypothetical protein OG792_25470 [Micromonospora sp. NBC_01699]|uniref:hypothetical protein n=1 Tax=Micromonospora sp. NBC_01699 TaxID=2975984 RepID=UPI002E27E022|nr:hypothetical protein [Micromonospora sp. NBC_01699]
MAPTPRRWRRTATVLAAIVTIVAVVAGVSPATAGPPDDPYSAVQVEIDKHLAAYPGGRQINPTEISYADGAFVLTFERPVGTTASPDCAAGWFCFYDRINYGYPRGQLSSCGWQDLVDWGWTDRTESVHFNISYGSVSFLNHTTAGHGGDAYLFAATASAPTDPDVAPNRNIADHVNRYC